MKRREFITLVGGAAAAWPLAARAQQPAMPVVGFLGGASPEGIREASARVPSGAGKRQDTSRARTSRSNIAGRKGKTIDGRRSPELVHRRVAVIAAAGASSALAAKAATTTIPIVFSISVDLVAEGFVASLARPGGNLTGVTSLNVEVGPKKLELLHEMVPSATSMALLVNPTNPSIAEPFSRALQAAARAVGLQLHVLHASSEREIELHS